jgi:ribosomal protein L11 methyltransferase
MIAFRIHLKPGNETQAEVLRCALVNVGVRDEDIVEETGKGRTCLSLFLPSQSAAVRLRRSLGALRFGGLARIVTKVVRDKEWKTRWKTYLRPFFITSRIRVVPAWQRERYVCVPGDILIDTTSAFGTGLHATTKMMARYIARYGSGGKSFLDAGTGSGILSILAARYGFSEICAIDNDPAAITTAIENFKRNRISLRLISAKGLEACRFRQPFDFVAANLLTEDLIRMKKNLVDCVGEGGILAVSGIYDDNYASFKKRFQHSSLEFLGDSCQQKWHAVVYKKM